MVVPGHAQPAEGASSGEPASSSSASSSSSHLSSGAIAGIVTGAVMGILAAIAILAALFFFMGRNRVYREWMSSQDAHSSRAARWVMSNNGGGGYGGLGNKMDYKDSLHNSLPYLSTPTSASGGGAGGDLADSWRSSAAAYYSNQQQIMNMPPPAMTMPPCAPVELEDCPASKGRLLKRSE